MSDEGRDITISTNQFGCFVSKTVTTDWGWQMLYLGQDSKWHTAMAETRGLYFDTVREAVEALAKGEL